MRGRAWPHQQHLEGDSRAGSKAWLAVDRLISSNREGLGRTVPYKGRVVTAAADPKPRRRVGTCAGECRLDDDTNSQVDLHIEEHPGRRWRRRHRDGRGTLTQPTTRTLEVCASTHEVSGQAMRKQVGGRSRGMQSSAYLQASPEGWQRQGERCRMSQRRPWRQRRTQPCVCSQSGRSHRCRGGRSETFAPWRDDHSRSRTW